MKKTATPEKRSPLFGYGLVLLGALGFATKAIFVKLAYADSSHIDAITLLALRMLFSLPFFLLIGFWQNRKSTAPALSYRQWLMVTILGLLGFYIASYLDFLGLQSISAGLERVILFLYPTFVVIFSAIARKRWVSIREVVALLLSYAGMLLVFVEHLSEDSSGLWLGSLLVLASAVSFAWFTMGSGVMTKSIGSTRFTAYTMAIASIATLVHFMYLHGFKLDGFPIKVYGLVAMMAIFSTVLPAFFMNAGIRRVGANSSAIISTTGPIMTLFLAYVFLDEAITSLQLTGTVFVLAGVYVVGRSGRS